MPANDDLELPRPASQDTPALAWSFDLGSVGTELSAAICWWRTTICTRLSTCSESCGPWWRRNGAGAADLIRDSLAELRVAEEQRCENFDAQLIADARRVGGDKYAVLVALAYRQSLAAQKLVADIDGTPYSFPKENFSNGCIATVDVIYPQSPQLMLFSATLLKASLTPILEYARSGRAGSSRSRRTTWARIRWRTVRFTEAASARRKTRCRWRRAAISCSCWRALAKVEGNADYAQNYWPLLDAMGRLSAARRARSGEPTLHRRFRGPPGAQREPVDQGDRGRWRPIASSANWTERDERCEGLPRTGRAVRQPLDQMAVDGEHYKLAFDNPGTWSQKYNLVWDRLLGCTSSAARRARRKSRSIETKQNKYGLPLDNRKTYTKLDWTCGPPAGRLAGRRLRGWSRRSTLGQRDAEPRSAHRLVRHDERQAGGLSGALGSRRTVHQNAGR